jgi:hypothetical protein
VGIVEDKLKHVVDTVLLEGERTRAALGAGLQETQRGLRVDGAASKPVAENRVNYNGARRLVGWSLRAVTADVVVNIRDGVNTGADVLASFTVTVAGPGSTVSLPGGGVSFTDGLFVETTTTGGGSLVGALWFTP